MPAAPALLGDYSRNNEVDATDYVLWRKTLNTTGVPAYSAADGDGDTTIDQDDYGVWRAHFLTADVAASGSGQRREQRDNVGGACRIFERISRGGNVEEPYHWCSDPIWGVTGERVSRTNEQSKKTSLFQFSLLPSYPLILIGQAVRGSLGAQPTFAWRTCATLRLSPGWHHNPTPKSSLTTLATPKLGRARTQTFRTRCRLILSNGCSHS